MVMSVLRSRSGVLLLLLLLDVRRRYAIVYAIGKKHASSHHKGIRGGERAECEAANTEHDGSALRSA